MFVWALKNFIKTVLALALAVALVFAVTFFRGSRFSALKGERVFYLYSASSQAVIKEKITLPDLFFIKGECVTLPCADQEETLQRLLRLYKAEILFEEQVGEVHSYYCRTLNWGDKTKINGVFVNLHIAFNEGSCVVGAPLIFGGF